MAVNQLAEQLARKNAQLKAEGALKQEAPKQGERNEKAPMGEAIREGEPKILEVRDSQAHLDGSGSEGLSGSTGCYSGSSSVSSARSAECKY